MIRILSCVLGLCICTSLVSCDNKNNVSDNKNTSIEQIDTESLVQEEYSRFQFLDNLYEKNEDITLLDSGTEIYNSKSGQEYLRGKYIEGDFAIDLVTKYLEGNNEIYQFLYSDIDGDNNIVLINDDEKERLNESREFLKEQMGIAEDQPIYFKLDKLIYNGQSSNNDNEIEFEVRGFISAYSNYFASISTFTVTVCKNKDKIYGNIN